MRANGYAFQLRGYDRAHPRVRPDREHADEQSKADTPELLASGANAS